MASKTLYFLGTTAVTPNWYGAIQDGGTAPTAANSAFGWGPAKTATSTPFYRGRIGATGTSGTAASATNYLTSSPGNTGPQPGTGSGTTTAGDSFVTPTSYLGTFDAGTWTLNFNMRAGVAGAAGRIRCSVWRSTSISGTSATNIVSDQIGTTQTLSTTAAEQPEAGR